MFARGIQPPVSKSAVKCETSLEYWWCIGSCSDRQAGHSHGLVDNTVHVKDDLSHGDDTMMSAMVLTIENRSRSKPLAWQC